jgi:hypothetical protein
MNTDNKSTIVISHQRWNEMRKNMNKTWPPSIHISWKMLQVFGLTVKEGNAGVLLSFNTENQKSIFLLKF